jgi:DHA1 family bicyclomycin/chloramphenicol resistance-like MFS transporter
MDGEARGNVANQTATNDYDSKSYLLTFTVALLAMLAPFSIDTYLPSFVALGDHFQISQEVLQQSISLYMIGFAATTLIYGSLSDSFGRRRVIIIALLFYILSSIGCFMAEDYTTFLLMRVGQGLSASAGMVIGRAVIRDRFEGAQARQAMSYVMLLFSLAPAIAPMIGGVLQEWLGWRSVFLFLTILGGITTLYTLRYLPETLPPEERQPFRLATLLTQSLDALSHHLFVRIILTIAFAFAGLFIYIVGAPVVIFDHLALGPGDFWLLFVPMVVGMMLGSFASGRLAHRLTSHFSISMAFGLLISASIINLLQAQLLTPTPLSVIAPMVLYAFGMAWMLPNLTIMSLDCFPHRRGLAASMQGFVQTVGGAVAAGIIVPIISNSNALFTIAQSLLLVVALLLWWSLNHRQT